MPSMGSRTHVMPEVPGVSSPSSPSTASCGPQLGDALAQQSLSGNVHLRDDVYGRGLGVGDMGRVPALRDEFAGLPRERACRRKEFGYEGIVES